MATTFSVTELTISAHYLSAIINDDYSSFSLNDTDDEEHALRAWLEDMRAHEGHFDINSNSDAYFGTCDVTGLAGDVIDVLFYRRRAL